MTTLDGIRDTTAVTVARLIETAGQVLMNAPGSEEDKADLIMLTALIMEAAGLSSDAELTVQVLNAIGSARVRLRKLEWHPGTHPWDTHDGYPRHQHSLNGALTIAPGDTWLHFAHGPAFS